MTAQPAPPDYALRGYRASLGRLLEAANTDDDDQVLVSLSEHLHWMYAVMEWWKRFFDDAGHKATFLKARELDPQGQAAAALEWARGFVTHELVEVAHNSELHPGQDTFPGADLYLGKFWRWRVLDGVDKQGRHKLYASRVVHRDLDTPIEAARMFLQATAPRMAAELGLVPRSSTGN